MIPAMRVELSRSVLAPHVAWTLRPCSSPRLRRLCFNRAAGRRERMGEAPMPPGIVALVTALLMLATTANAQTLTYRGCYRLPPKQFPGLSGITYAGEGKFFGVLEWEAQVIPMQITFAADGEIQMLTPGTPVKIAGGKVL